MKHEDKELFVRRLNEALIECGAGRYDFLADTPMVYEDRAFEESVELRGAKARVTGDSLTALAIDVFRELFR